MARTHGFFLVANELDLSSMTTALHYLVPLIPPNILTQDSIGNSINETINI